MTLSKQKKYLSSTSSFTLIELLIVVAILAILATAVIVTLNPQELIKQSRDSARLNDISAINNSLNYYVVDQPNSSLGTASTTYISIPDPTATSTTQGNQCAGLGMPSLPSGYSYHCSASSTYRNTDGNGWIPLNFQAMSFNSTLGALPVDPINTTSSGNYYTYTPGGSWQLTATPESSKVRTSQANQQTGAITIGSDLSLSPLFNPTGLVGYWKFDEGTGSTARDSAGGNNGTLVSSPSWVAGKLGNALSFNGGGGAYVSVSSPITTPTNLTISLWANVSQSTGFWSTFVGSESFRFSISSASVIATSWTDGVNSPSFYSSNTFNLGQWQYVSLVKSGSNIYLYINGVQKGSGTTSYSRTISNVRIGRDGLSGIGSPDNITGIIDDVRIYNRALSAAEIMALYNATR